MPVRLEIPGIDKQLDLCLHETDDICVSRQIREQGIWEPYETALLVRYLRPGGVFLDIGANIGYYAVVASSLVGDQGRVVAYEPDRDNFHLLQENLAVNGITNVCSVQAAVADYNGSTDLYLCGHNKGDHQLYDNGNGRRHCAVEVVHGGEHVGQITRRVDFVKIDTQGSEVVVIKGLYDILRDNSDHLAMVIELWPYGLRQAGSSGRELLDLLAPLDLSLFIIDHIGHSLWPAPHRDVLGWVEETDTDENNQGFINLLALSDPYIMASNDSTERKN